MKAKILYSVRCFKTKKMKMLKFQIKKKSQHDPTTTYFNPSAYVQL